MLVQKEADAGGGRCLICLATVGPFPGGFPTGTLTRQVLETRRFLSLGPIIFQPLTLLPLTRQPSKPGQVAVPCVALTTSPMFVREDPRSQAPEVSRVDCPAFPLPL